MKRWLRNWLGVTDFVNDSQDYQNLRITALEQLRPEVMEALNRHQGRLEALEQLHNDFLSKSNDLQSALQEIRQIRETVLDPKKVPIATRNSRQFRALVEQDAG